MPNLVVLGAQWGDEGKGKIVDLLTSRFDAVVRYQGGANAGHTVVADGEKHVLHLVPSGIIGDVGLCIVANGVVVDPIGLVAELDALREKDIGIDGRFFLSDRAQVVMPYHSAVDGWSEERLGKDSIGTTRRGIGPAYESKIARSGLRVGDLLDESSLKGKVDELLERVNELATRLYGAEPFVLDDMLGPFAEAGRRLAPYICDTSDLIMRTIESGKSVIFEGAQGTMLDIDHGSYPYVTSSNTTVGGVCTGTGVPPRYLHSILGVTKAYCTRVGKGPFPSEEHGPTGERIRERGGEYGATTGRPRRCGWFDAVAARYAARINGFDALAVTKIDVLDGLEEVPVCVAYELDGKRIESVPASAEALERCKPVYEVMPGWREETTGVDDYESMPDGAKRYLDYLCGLLDLPLALVATGPDRCETAIREEVMSALIGGASHVD